MPMPGPSSLDLAYRRMKAASPLVTRRSLRKARRRKDERPAGPKLKRGRGIARRRRDILAPLRWVAYLLAAAAALLLIVRLLGWWLMGEPLLG
jgi:hypothetical protein